MINGYLARIDELGPHVVRAAKTADQHACDVKELLEAIRDNTANLYNINVYESPGLPFSVADTKTVDGRQGYAKMIKRIAVVTAVAVDVDVFVNDPGPRGFRERVSLAAAGSLARALEVPVPEGSSVIVVASAACQVNLVLQRMEL